MAHLAELDALVVGAGPVGLVAALFLRDCGLEVDIVDMHQRTTQHSYALALHPSTLRVLDEAGLTAELVAKGRTVTKVAFFDGRDKHVEIDYSAIGSTHPHLLVLRQSLLERAVEKALDAKGLKVRWRHRLEALSAGGSTIEAQIAELDQVAEGYPIARTEWVVTDTTQVRAGYVLGADGYDSAVRRMTGIGMAEHGPAEVFSIYEIEAKGELPGDVRVILEDHQTSVYWPLEPGRCRWGFQIRDAADHVPSIERLQQLIAARAPWFSAQPDVIYWSTLALFESRLAHRFGQGRVSLAGDAAHQAAPVGVHSMNAGIAEARELALLINRVHAGESPALLEEFGQQAHEEWRQLLGAGRAVRALAGADPWVERNRARIVACMPASGNDLETLLKQVGLTAPA